MTTPRLQRLRALFPVAVLCLALAALPGCKKERATVTGKVTFNKQPLTAGTVTFVLEAGVVGTGTIRRDGTYTVADAPVGEVTVTVTTPPLPQGPPMGMPKAPKDMKMPAEMIPEGAEEGGQPIKVVPAPEKYAKPDTSPLRFTVQRGEQTYDIPLTP